MTKLLYLAAMALLGLGLTMAQSGTPASDSSNSSKPAQAQGDTSTSSSTNSATRNPKRTQHAHGQRSEEKVPDTTIQDHPSGTTSTTGASGQGNSTPSSSNMGTTGSNPEPEKTQPANHTGAQPGGDATDQQPNASSSPSPHHVALNSTPAARAMATHSPDPGTCMNPAAMDSNGNGSSSPARTPNCD